MDAINTVAHTVYTYAALGTQGVAIIGFFLMTLLATAMLNNPDVTMVVCILLALAISWHIFRPIRRFIRVFVTWPLGRLSYRLVKRPVRQFVGGIMARWKTAVVADRLNDTLEKLCYDDHVLSPTEYRRLSNLLGKTMGLQDLRARKLTNKKGIERTVLENIGIMKATPQVPGPPRKVDVDPTYDPKTGKVMNLAFLRTRRNSAA